MPPRVCLNGAAGRTRTRTWWLTKPPLCQVKLQRLVNCDDMALDEYQSDAVWI